MNYMGYISYLGNIDVYFVNNLGKELGRHQPLLNYVSQHGLIYLMMSLYQTCLFLLFFAI